MASMDDEQEVNDTLGQLLMVMQILDEEIGERGRRRGLGVLGCDLHVMGAQEKNGWRKQDGPDCTQEHHAQA